jgi:hypothetical protein
VLSRLILADNIGSARRLRRCAKYSPSSEIDSRRATEPGRTRPLMPRPVGTRAVARAIYGRELPSLPRTFALVRRDVAT